jgi:hypothetical protein
MAFFTTQELKKIVIRYLSRDQWFLVSELAEKIYPFSEEDSPRQRRQYSAKIGQVLHALHKEGKVEYKSIKTMVRAWKITT